MSNQTQTGEALNLEGLTDPNCTEIEGLPNSAVLLRFVDAFMSLDAEKLTAAREALVEQMGPVAMVDAAGVASNFQRMVRIADATGIPAEDWGDEQVDAMRQDIVEKLGIDQYASAVNTTSSEKLTANRGWMEEDT